MIISLLFQEFTTAHQSSSMPPQQDTEISEQLLYQTQAALAANQAAAVYELVQPDNNK